MAFPDDLLLNAADEVTAQVPHVTALRTRFHRGLWNEVVIGIPRAGDYVDLT